MSQPAPGRITTVELTVTDDSYPFVGVSAAADCELVLERLVPDGEDGYRELFSAGDVDGTRVVDLLSEEYDVGHRLLADRRAVTLVSLTVSDPYACVVATMGEVGAVWREVRADGGTGHVTAVCPPARCSQLLSTLETEHPTVELRTKTTDDVSPSELLAERKRFFRELLTDRQFEVLEAAVEAGYFEHPRAITGTALAADLGISQTTFAQHLRAAQRKLFTDLYGLGEDR